MKYISKYFLGLSLMLAAGFSSCTGDLDVPPKDPNQDTPEKMFAADPRGTMDRLLAECYQGLATAGNKGAGESILGFGDAGAGTFTRTIFNLEELTTDHFSWLQFSDGGYYELVTMAFAPDNEVMYAAYSRIYGEIALCNEFIRTIQQYRSYLSDGDQAAADDAIRQAKILRSLAYFYAISDFGSAGYVDETTEAGTAPVQYSRADLYNKVVSTLEEVSAEYGDSYTAPAYGYVGKEAADALLARFYVNAGVFTGTPAYDKCWNICQKIIAHHQGAGFDNSGLSDSYKALFGANNKEYAAQGSRVNEIIFTIPQDGINLQAYGGSTFFIAACCGSYDGISSINDCNLNAQWTCMGAREQLSRKFEFDGHGFTNDARAELWKTSKDGFEIGNSTIMGNAGFGKGYAPLKYTNYAYDEFGNIDTENSPNGSERAFADADWTVIRLAEIYLNAVEANVVGNVGNQADALKYINYIRERAGVTTWGVASLTADNILAERSRELYGENIRRTDLVRFGKYAGGGYVWNWKGGVREGREVDAHFNLFPIPSKVISFQKYEQNTGYGK